MVRLRQSHLGLGALQLWRAAAVHVLFPSERHTEPSTAPRPCRPESFLLNDSVKVGICNRSIGWKPMKPGCRPCVLDNPNSGLLQIVGGFRLHILQSLLRVDLDGMLGEWKPRRGCIRDGDDICPPNYGAEPRAQEGSPKSHVYPRGELANRISRAGCTLFNVDLKRGDHLLINGGSITAEKELQSHIWGSTTLEMTR